MKNDLFNQTLLWKYSKDFNLTPVDQAFDYAQHTDDIDHFIVSIINKSNNLFFILCLIVE